MPYSFMRAELGLSFEDILYNISYVNLIMLSKCTPNYNFDKKDKGGISRNLSKEPPEFGAKGNAGGFSGLVEFFKGVKTKK